LFAPHRRAEQHHANHDRSIRKIEHWPESKINEIYDRTSPPPRGSKEAIGQISARPPKYQAKRNHPAAGGESGAHLP
jgi:hypothetical protein